MPPGVSHLFPMGGGGFFRNLKTLAIQQPTLGLRQQSQPKSLLFKHAPRIFALFLVDVGVVFMLLHPLTADNAVEFLGRARL